VNTHVPSVSPELALVDPELALRLRESDMHGAVVREDHVHDANNGNGSAPTVPQARPEEARSLEALLFHGGLITADQLGDLIREQTATGTPVEELVRSRGYVQPEVLDRLLGRTQQAAEAPTAAEAAPEAGGFIAPIELVPAAEAPAPAVAAVPEPTPIPAPEPVAVAAVEAPAPAAEVVVELPTAFAAPEPELAPMAEVTPMPVVEAAPAPVVELSVAPAPAPMPEPEPAPPQVEPEPPAAEHDPEPAPEIQTVPELAFDVLVRLADGYELLASSHASLADGEQAARALAAGGDWLDVGDGIVQRHAVAAILVRPRSSR
jgi:hypothetical protein